MLILLIAVLCWVSLDGVAANKSLCRASCSADPDENPCDNKLPVIPRFLLAGQSNAQGFSDQALDKLHIKSISVVREKFKRPLPSTKEQHDQRRIEVTEALIKIIEQGEGASNASAYNEANLMYDMAGNNKTTSILKWNTINQPHPDVVCSYTRPDQMETIDCERPVSPKVGRTCGGGNHELKWFGPELMFSHHFRNLDTKYKNNTFGITKVAVGGTKIKEFMKGSKSDRNFWQSLKDNIIADKGTQEAFFWFQGESDMFPATSQEEYHDNLKELVKRVRGEIFKAHKKRWGKEGSPTAKFKKRADVPVVIFELGSWIGNGVSAKKGGVSPGPVILAQRQFVQGDENAILVNTGTADNEYERLSSYYHFDAPSQLIIGQRMADQFQKLLGAIEARKLVNTTLVNATLVNATSDMLT